MNPWIVALLLFLIVLLALRPASLRLRMAVRTPLAGLPAPLLPPAPSPPD